MSDELVGTTLSGRYRVLFPIAKGGMGAVYEAEDLRAQRRVALKVVRTEFLRDVVSLERFRREATLSATIKHPSLVATLDLSLDSDPAFFVMELLDGPTLAELLSHADRLPWERAARVAIDVADGLAALHAAGAVHRDIKPSNVMLVRDSGGERAKIIDFGVVRSAVQPDDESLTWTGNVVGTPAFMAPEQLSGADVDARADLYSLGVLAAKMLLGTHVALRVPLDRSAVIEGWPESVPDAFRALVTSLLRASPDDRPESARHVAARLADLLASHASAPSVAQTYAQESSYGGYTHVPLAPVSNPGATFDPASLRVGASDQGPHTISTASPGGENPPSAPNTPIHPSLPTNELPSREAPRKRNVSTTLAAIGAGAGALLVVVVIALAARFERGHDASSAIVAQDVVAPDRPSPYPLRVDQTPLGPRYTPTGTRLQFNVGGANDDAARRDVVPSLGPRIERCVDLRAHTLGAQIVSVLLEIDARGVVLRNQRDELMTATPTESACVDQAIRAAQWPTSPIAYSLRFIATSL